MRPSLTEKRRSGSAGGDAMTVKMMTEIGSAVGVTRTKGERKIAERIGIAEGATTATRSTTGEKRRSDGVETGIVGMTMIANAREDTMATVTDIGRKTGEIAIMTVGGMIDDYTASAR